jgi:hypothetical protein
VARVKVVVKALCGFENQLCELIFSIYLIVPAALGPGVYSASNGNEYQKHKIMFLESTAWPVRRAVMFLESTAWPVRRADELTAISELTN